MRSVTVTIILLLALASAVTGRVEAQRRPELFREYFSATTALFKAEIPTETCRTLITQADDIVSGGNLKTAEPKNLQIASLNLRVCATTDSLARIERDLAVGLYAEFVSELERRKKERK